MKAQIMTITMLLIFVMLLIELFAFTELSTGYNQIASQSYQSLSSNNYFKYVSSTSGQFATASASRALSTLVKYESDPSVRKDNLVDNFSKYLTYLIRNGTLPGVQPGSTGYAFLQSNMNNLTLASYNASVSKAAGLPSSDIKINETDISVFQSSPYNINVSYVENIVANYSGGNVSYSIPVRTSIPINGTEDLIYAEQGLSRIIKFGNLQEAVSVIGTSPYSHATYGSSSSFVYGTVYYVPAADAECPTINSYIPSAFQIYPFNLSLILATPDATKITNSTCNVANKYGGIVSYSFENTPKVPYLNYSSASKELNSLYTGRPVLLYGPTLSLLDISNLKNYIENGYYFVSQYAPDYISTESDSFYNFSNMGIVTFSNYHRTVASLNGASSYIKSPYSWSSSNKGITVSAWVYLTSIPSDNAGIVSAVSTTNYGTISMFLNSNCFVQAGVTTTSWQETTGSYCLKVDRWYNIVAWANQTSGKYGLYINGVSNFTGAFSGTLEPATAFDIGEFPYASAYLPGYVADVQIYNKSLSQPAVKKIFSNGIGIPPAGIAGLSAWYPLDGNANDYSGNNNNGTLTDVQFFSPPNYSFDSMFHIYPIPQPEPIPGIMASNNNSESDNPLLPHLYLSDLSLLLSNQFGQSARFNGISSYLDLASPTALPTGTQITATAWIKPTSVQTGGSISCFTYYCGVFGYGPRTCDYSSFEMMIQSNLLPSFSTYCDHNFPTSGPTFKPNTWNFYAVVLDGQSVTYYVNSQVLATTIPYMPNVQSGPVVISGSDYPPEKLFNGSIANVQLYGTSLPQSAIYSIMNGGLHGSPDINYGQYLSDWWPLNGNADDNVGSNNLTNYDTSYGYVSANYSSYSSPKALATESEWGALGLVYGNN